MSIVDSFDAQSSAVFSPCDVYKPLEGFPEIALIAFNRRMVDFAAGQPGAGDNQAPLCRVRNPGICA